MSLHVAVAIDIPAPVDKVWAIAQDPSRRPLWDPRIARYEVHGTSGAGTEVTITVRMGPFRPVAKGVLRRWEPPHQSVMQTLSASSRMVSAGAGSWTFEPNDRGTRFTTRFTLDERQLHPLIWPWLYARLAHWDTWRALRRLRRLIAEMD